MTPERWQQIRDLLDGAMQLEPRERRTYLDHNCSADPTLRREVDSLLMNEAGLGEFLEVPAAEQAGLVAGVLDAEPAAGWVGRRIGAYQIIEQIGRGGMGEVYKAVRADDQYRKQVAVKLVRTGFASNAVLMRFKAERQILASLEHPNITRLLDGGTTDSGVPYFVMELVEGQPIDVYCDGHSLPIIERLKLFLNVCSAVQYAHQNLYIHRDLKPSNILVTANGTPKLLDFGIAKILDPTSFPTNTDATITGMRVLTPEYSSPEQVRGEVIATTSDVYSLGVVLYILLTGCHPCSFGGRTALEVARAVCDTEPSRPSETVHQDNGVGVSVESISLARGTRPEKLRRQLSGDLDNIVLRALRKEPQRRYPSVEQLAQDIRRHLDNLPVQARPDTFGYRASKFAHRHKAGVIAAVTVILTILAGLTVILREVRIARAERARAEQRFNDVRALASSDLFELHDAISQLPGSASARHLVIQRSLLYLDRLSKDRIEDRDLMRELSVGYQRIADLQGNFSGPGIGDSKAALASYSKALALREALVAGSKNDINELQGELKLFQSYLRCLLATGRVADGSRMARRALQVAEEIAHDQPQDAAQVDVVRAHLQLGWFLGGNGSSPSTREIPEAIEHDRQALSALKQVAGGNPTAPLRAAISSTNLTLAFHLNRARQFEDSQHLFDEVIAAEKDRPSLSVYMLAIAYNSRGMMFERSGEQRKALADYSQSLEVAQKVVAADASDLDARTAAEIEKAHVAMQRARLGETKKGLNTLETIILRFEPVASADPTKTFYQNLLGIGYSYCGEILSVMGSHEEARASYAKALSTAEAISKIDSEDLDSRLTIAKTHVATGVVMAKAMHYSEAQKELDLGVASAQELLRLRPADSEVLETAGNARADSAMLKGCSDGQSCRAAAGLPLPTPIN